MMQMDTHFGMLTIIVSVGAGVDEALPGNRRVEFYSPPTGGGASGYAPVSRYGAPDVPAMRTASPAPAAASRTTHFKTDGIKLGSKKMRRACSQWRSCVEQPSIDL